ncbi:hypothetical protein GIB67_026832 [Kingdonia uniflora]|uniref:Aminotransferase-like plant mobile domain-containing protein n=1 Tax=Kingdonia uniflora TaxID=39325 RepID=A0A7J7MHK9_9MAGN|nr:hypothetical protein GIB67_026832 [Kingdonia uniflora]
MLFPDTPYPCRTRTLVSVSLLPRLYRGAPCLRLSRGRGRSVTRSFAGGQALADDPKFAQLFEMIGNLQAQIQTPPPVVDGFAPEVEVPPPPSSAVPEVLPKAKVEPVHLNEIIQNLSNNIEAKSNSNLLSTARWLGRIPQPPKPKVVMCSRGIKFNSEYERVLNKWWLTPGPMEDDLKEEEVPSEDRKPDDVGMAPKVARKMPTIRRKRVPTASLRKRLNDEREDPSHPNYNNPPRIPGKRRKTCSTRVPLRDSSISGSLPRVSVTPELEDHLEGSSKDSSAVKSSTVDSQGESAEDFRGEDPGFNPDLKAGGQGISLSLKKIVDFFVGKVGKNASQGAATSSSSPPIKLSSRMVGKAYMLYVLGSFLFPTKKGTDVSVKYLSFFQDKHVNKPWSWGAATLAHLYYSLGASSRVNAKGLVCCTTLLESWIFEHFPKLPGIPTPNQSGVAEFCTRKVHDEIAVCTEGYFEWFNSVSFTKLCPDVVNLAEDDDYDEWRVLEDRGSVVQRENVEVPHSQNEGDGGPTEVVEDPVRSVLVEALVAKTSECAFLMEANLKMQACIQAKDVANSICEKKLNEKTLECELNKKLVEDLRMQLADKVKVNETLSSINDKLMEEVYVNQEARPLPLNLVPHSEENVVEAEMWKQKYEELNAKFEEAQRRLSVRDINVKVTHDRWYAKYIHETEKLGVWHLALKGTIEGGDFEDIEDLTWEEISRQFTKLLTITQEGPKGEDEDDIILSGRGEYQEMIDSRLKKIDQKTNLRQTLFQLFNWFQLDIRDVERDGNTVFRVAVSYVYKSQIKFLNVKDSLCTLMTKKPSYWKSIYSQRLDVAYSDLGERRYETLLRAFKFNAVFVEYLYMGHLLATYYEKVGHLYQQQGGLNVPTFVLVESKQHDCQRENV